MMWSSIYRYRLASPSSSAPVLYGFPAGRPFRVIGRSAGFAHIQDLKSSARAVTADSRAATQPSRKRPGLFGRGGLFGGIFSNGN